MAIGVTHRATAGSGTNAASYASASFTPSANVLLVAAYATERGGGNAPTQPTVSGHGTWSLIATLAYVANESTLFIFACDTGASPGASAVTFDHGATTHLGAEWSIFEVTGSDLASGGGGSTVAQCFVQTPDTGAGDSGTSNTATLASAGAADNRAFYVQVIQANEAITERNSGGAGAWTEIAEGGHNAPTRAIESQWRSDAFETTASASWTSSVANGGIAFEVKALVTGGQTVTGAVLTVTPSLPAGSLVHTLTGVALSASPSLPAGRVDHTITAAALSVTPTLPAGDVRDRLEGATLTVTPSLPAGTVNHTLTGVALSVTPSLPAGTVTAIVTGAALSVTPTLPAGRVDHTLTGAALEVTPALPAGTISSGQIVTGAALTITPTLPAGALTHTLTGVVLTVTPTLPAGSLEHRLTGAALTIVPTLPAGSLIHELVGQVLTITPTLPAGAVQPDQSLTGVVLAVVPTLPAGSVVEQGTTVTGVVLVVVPTLPPGVVSRRTFTIQRRRYAGSFLTPPRP